MFEKFEPDANSVEEARRLYDQGAAWKDVAAALGASIATARKYAKIWGWPEREKATPAVSSRTAKAQKKYRATSKEKENSCDDIPSLARRVETAVRKELTAVERRLGSSTAAAAERNARVLASLVKSLAELRKLERDDRQDETKRNEGDNDDGPRPPRDLARLREELEATLARIQSSAESDPEDRSDRSPIG